MPQLSVTIPQSVLDQDAEADAALRGEEQPVAEETTPEESPSPEPEPQATPEPEAEPAPSVEDEGWMNRYKTLSGKYNAEVPRLHAEVRQLRETLEELKSLRDSQPHVVEREEAPVNTKPGYTRHLKESELQEYGESLLDMQSRMARGVAEEVADAYRKEIAELRDQIGALSGKVEQAQGETFWDRLERVVPGAIEINKADPLWHAFLGEVDPITGETYRAIGTRAVRAGAVQRMANLFGIFQRSYASSGTGVDDTAATPKETVAAPVAKPVGSRSVSQAPVEKAPRVFKESEVATFYADLNRGRYAGREKLAAEREAEIEQAASEGRVIAG